MITVTATYFQRRVGEMMDRALIEPVRITQHKRNKAVLMSEEFYQQLISSLGVQAFKTENLPENVLRTISKPLTQEEFEAGGAQKVER